LQKAVDRQCALIHNSHFKYNVWRVIPLSNHRFIWECQLIRRRWYRQTFYSRLL